MVKTKKLEQDTKVIAYKDFLPNGDEIIEIPLYDDPDPSLPKVIMSLWRFKQLMRLGMTTRPRVTKNGYIEIWCPYSKEYVRLVLIVADMNSDETVTFRDGNECNMLESNIDVKPRPEPTVYRKKHLNADVTGTYNEDIDIKDKDKNKPRLPIDDPLATAWANNKYIQKGIQFN